MMTRDDARAAFSHSLGSGEHRAGAPAYFNMAYMGLMPDVALAALQAGARGRAAPWAIAPADFFTVAEAARSEAAALFAAPADHIAIVGSVSYATAMAAKNLPLRAGQNVVLLADQFPSHVYVWRAAAAAVGGQVRTVHRPANAPWTPAILDAIDADTAIVATPQCHWVDGGVIDVAAVGKAARAVGAGFVLDLTQSLGALPFDAAAAQPDFAVAATYKWLLGPYSLAVCYVAPHHHAGSPLEEAWLTRAGAEDFAGLTRYQEAYQPGARRFDMGERSNFVTLPAATASMAFLNQADPKWISRELGTMTGEIAAQLAQFGYREEPGAHRAPHYLSLTAPPGSAEDLVARARDQGVHISKRGARLRITGHVHTNANDISRLITTLGALCGTSALA